MLVLLVVGIAILIVILKDSRDHIRAQDAKTAVLLSTVRAATPTAREVPSLLHEARPAVRGVRRAIGPIRQATDATATATERLPNLIHVTETVAQVALPTLTSLGRVAYTVLYRNRLATALDSTNALLAEIRSDDLVPDAARAAHQTPGLIRRLLRLQLVTLRIQKRSLRTQLTTLDIQRQALVSIKSIDRKTGGTVPSQGPPVPAP